MTPPPPRKLRLQHKLLLLCAGLLIVSTAGSMVVIGYLTWQHGWETIGNNLNRALRAFKKTQEDRWQLSDQIAISLRSDAGLHQYIEQVPDSSSWHDHFIDLRNNSEEDPDHPQLLFLLTDRRGFTRVRTDRVAQPTNEDLSATPLVKMAMDQDAIMHGYWATHGDVYQCSAVNWNKGSDVDGALLVGWRVDDRLASMIKKMTDTEVAIISNGQVLGSSDPELNAAILQADRQGLQTSSNLPGMLTAHGQRWLNVTEPLQAADKSVVGTIVLLTSLDRQMAYLRHTEELLIGLGVGVILVGILISTVLSRRVTQPVLDLAQAARELGKGNYQALIPDGPQDEIGELASTFVQMREAILQQLVELKSSERVRRDLELAHHIQESLLPDHAPQVVGLDLAGICRTANRVGGDYFDFLQFEQQEVVDIVIADVFGHDVGAALMMATGRTALRSAAAGDKSPCQIITQTNRTLFPDLAKAELLISLAYVRVDPKTGQIVYANAGHNLP
ncbi:MAG: PP2C family protein-serine/threonine phosphatase, partial [Candidatus Xenobia bacterium]